MLGDHAHSTLQDTIHKKTKMQTAQKIVGLLNSLLQNESEENCKSIQFLMSRGVEISDEIQDEFAGNSKTIQFFLSRGIAISKDVITEFVNTRTVNTSKHLTTVDSQKYLTFTGIISGIGEAIGEPIASVYADDDLIGFALLKDCGGINSDAITPEPIQEGCPLT